MKIGRILVFGVLLSLITTVSWAENTIVLMSKPYQALIQESNQSFQQQWLKAFPFHKGDFRPHRELFQQPQAPADPQQWHGQSSSALKKMATP
jgi:hypothetical protein